MFTAHTFSYATMSNSRYNSVHLFVLTILLLNSGQTLCHTKGLRTRNPRGVPPMMNASRVQFSEQQFMKWVTFVGSLKHSVFKAAKNKIFPSYTLIVAKNPSAGDFTTIQEAIDSLPFINLVRVIIKIRAGVYKWVLSLSFPPCVLCISLYKHLWSLPVYVLLCCYTFWSDRKSILMHWIELMVPPQLNF